MFRVTVTHLHNSTCWFTTPIYLKKIYIFINSYLYHTPPLHPHHSKKKKERKSSLLIQYDNIEIYVLYLLYRHRLRQRPPTATPSSPSPSPTPTPTPTPTCTPLPSSPYLPTFSSSLSSPSLPPRVGTVVAVVVDDGSLTNLVPFPAPCSTRGHSCYHIGLHMSVCITMLG